MSQMITLSSKGDFSKATNYLQRLKHLFNKSILDEYGQRGVEMLKNATPKDTGATASMWRYEIQNTSTGTVLSFHNDNINDGVNIAIILQYGHGVHGGGWVSGTNYINPEIRQLFEDLKDRIWKEVTRR